MTRDRGIRTLSVAAIAVALVALSVGYAALSQRLNINGTTTVKKADWIIKFDNLATPVLAGSGTSDSTEMTATTFSFTASLTKPGDSVTYMWDVKNDGDIDAKLNAKPVLVGSSLGKASNVLYSFSYSDGTAISANDPLRVGETKTIMLVVSYKQSATTTASEDKALSLTTTLSYVQA